MEVTVYNNEQIVPLTSYNHIMPTSKVIMFSQVSNLLAFAKNLDLKKPAAEELLVFLTHINPRVELKNLQLKTLIGCTILWHNLKQCL